MKCAISDTGLLESKGALMGGITRMEESKKSLEDIEDMVHQIDARHAEGADQPETVKEGKGPRGLKRAYREDSDSGGDYQMATKRSRLQDHAEENVEDV